MIIVVTVGCCCGDKTTSPCAGKKIINELREGDYRQGEGFGSPWECMHPQGDYKQNPIYVTSVTGPLAAFKRLGW